MRSVFTSLVAAGLLVLAFPPYRAGFLAPVAAALLLWAIRKARLARTAILAGALFGLTFFTGLFYWIGELGLIALVPLVLAQAAYPTLYAGFLHLARGWPEGAWWMAATGGWAAMEFLRERFPLGGFPWGMLGYPVGEYAWSRAAAQWTGTSGWSVVLAGVAAGAVVAWHGGRQGWLVGPAAALAVLTAGGALLPAVADGPALRVAIVQGSTPCPGTHCLDERFLTYQTHLALTSGIPAGSVDLVVWPEGSTGGFGADPVLDPAVAAAIGSEARRLGAYLLAGGDRPISESEWINANVLFGPDGQIIDEYRKRHPVPFGEYVPARGFFGWIPELEAVPRDMVRGEAPKVFDLGTGRVGSVISFEGSFARYGRDTVRAGAELIVVATNEGSYPYSAASDQLIGMTRMRSAELGVDVVHAAVTGRSTIISGAGRIGPVTGLASAEVITGEVHLRNGGSTVYELLGDWVQVAAMVGLAAVIVHRAGGRPKAASAPARGETSPGTSRP